MDRFSKYSLAQRRRLFPDWTWKMSPDGRRNVRCTYGRRFTYYSWDLTYA